MKPLFSRRSRRVRARAQPLAAEVLELRLAPAGNLIVIETPTATDTVDDGRINFGGVKVGDSSVVEFTLRNTGGAAITVSSWTTTAPFLVTPPNLVAVAGDNITLGAGESVTLGAIFAPTAVRFYSGAIYIVSDDPLQTVLTVTLDGIGNMEDLVQSATLNKIFSFTDADGDLTVLSFRGGGQVHVEFGDFNGVGQDIQTLTFTGTSLNTKFRVASRGSTNVGSIVDVPDTGVGLGDLYIQGNLGSIAFENPIRNFRVTGTLGTDASVQAAEIAGAVTLFHSGTLLGILDFGSQVKTLRVTGDAVGAINIAVLGAPAMLNVLDIGGAAGSSILTPLDVSVNGSIGNIKVGGSMIGNFIATGNIGNIVAASIQAKISAGYGLDGLRNGDPTEIAATIGKVNTFLGDLRGTIQATAGIGQIGSAGHIRSGGLAYGSEIHSDANITSIRAVRDISSSLTAVGVINEIRTASRDRTLDGGLTGFVTAAAINRVVLEGLVSGLGGFSVAPAMLVIDSDGDGL